MTPSDWAAWVQAVGSIAAIGVAIWVPWQIHTREQSAAQRSRDAYRQILKDALQDLREPLGILTMFGTRLIAPAEEDEEAPARKWTKADRQAAVEVAADMQAALSAMTQTASILDEFDAIDGVDRYTVIRSLFHLRRKLREYLPMIKTEAQLLGDYPTPGVVDVAIQKLRAPTSDLLESIDEALTALSDGAQQ